MRRNPARAETAGWARKAPILLLMAATLALLPDGCSNESTTSGPVTLPVKLTVNLIYLRPLTGATVFVSNLETKTDNEGTAVFNTTIDVLFPNCSYAIRVPDFQDATQAYPETDSVKIPSEPTTAYGWDLNTWVLMQPKS